MLLFSQPKFCNICEQFMENTEGLDQSNFSIILLLKKKINHTRKEKTNFWLTIQEAKITMLLFYCTNYLKNQNYDYKNLWTKLVV
jgi:hypothetical protein